MNFIVCKFAIITTVLIIITMARQNFLSNKYVRFSVALLIYSLWVMWVNNYWLLFGIPVLFDIYITKKVPWAFWKPRGRAKNSKILEWIDAIIFAAVVVSFINIFFFQNYKIPTSSLEKSLLVGDHLFVSKYSYGPKIPNTPLSFPFIPHTLPFTEKTPSYLDWLEWDYHRLPGLTHIKRNDIVVFNFPEGDTILTDYRSKSYYNHIAQLAMRFQSEDMQRGNDYKYFSHYYNKTRKLVLDKYDFFTRPVDKTDNYVKRCVALPGDELEIINGYIYINNQKQKELPEMQFRYFIKTNNGTIDKKVFEELDVYEEDYEYEGENIYVAHLSNATVDKLGEKPFIEGIDRFVTPKESPDYEIFPHHENYKWNQDHFGPLLIPAKGETAELSLKNLPLYKRIIEVYEGNKLRVQDGKIYINDEEATSYTFKMDYYFMMGDNRHNSLDSRFWGLVPEDRVVGKPIFIYLSLDENKSWFKKIRWNRFFKKVR